MPGTCTSMPYFAVPLTFGGHVAAADVLAADQLELRRLLEIGLADLRRFRRHGGERHDFAVGDLAARFLVR